MTCLQYLDLGSTNYVTGEFMRWPPDFIVRSLIARVPFLSHAIKFYCLMDALNSIAHKNTQGTNKILFTFYSIFVFYACMQVVLG
jgi:hypothetical protein